jgi:hypothetical protein
MQAFGQYTEEVRDTFGGEYPTGEARRFLLPWDQSSGVNLSGHINPLGDGSSLAPSDGVSGCRYRT